MPATQGIDVCFIKTQLERLCVTRFKILPLYIVGEDIYLCDDCIINVLPSYRKRTIEGVARRQKAPSAKTVLLGKYCNSEQSLANPWLSQTFPIPHLCLA